MFYRSISMIALLAALALAACDGAQPTPPGSRQDAAHSATPGSVLTLAATATPLPTSAPAETHPATPDPIPTLTPTPLPAGAPAATHTVPSGPVPTVTPAPTLLPANAPAATQAHGQPTEEVPPCTPVPGSSVDPCEPGRGIPGATVGTASTFIGFEPFSVQTYLGGSGDFVPHIVLRGTYLPDAVRCAATDFRPRPDQAYGPLNGKPILKCYADVRVNAYVLGTGPSTLTVEVAHDILSDSWGETAIAEWKRLWERALVEGAVPDYWFQAIAEGKMNHEGVEGVPTNIYVRSIAGREAILFTGPAVGGAVEVWKVFST